MGTIRIGVVGVGFGQQVLVPAFRSDSRCEVRAICASAEAQAARVAAVLGIPAAFGDWRSLLDAPDIDAVAIATPPSIQPEIAVAALRRGKAVFCEKPLATSRVDALRMAEAAAEAGVANMVDFEFPEIEAWRRARAILDAGRIGRLRHLAVSWNVETYANRTGRRSWKSDAEAGGGALNALGAHALHAVEWFAGPIRGLSARLFRAPGDDRPGDTLAVLCAELETGAAASLSISTHAFLGSGHRLEFYGSEGTAVLENASADYARGFRLLHGTRAGERLEPLPTGEIPGPDGDGRVAAVARLVGRFVSWLATGEASAPGFAEGLRVQTLLEAARKADAARAWVAGPF